MRAGRLYRRHWVTAAEYMAGFMRRFTRATVAGDRAASYGVDGGIVGFFLTLRPTPGRIPSSATRRGAWDCVDPPFDSRTLRDAATNPRLAEGFRPPERVDHLCERLFGEPFRQRTGLNSRLADLPYRLAHGPVAVGFEAARTQADVAVFAVHELRTDASDRGKLDCNPFDWERPWTALQAPAPADGQLQEITLTAPTLLAGKAVSDVRGASDG